MGGDEKEGEEAFYCYDARVSASFLALFSSGRRCFYGVSFEVCGGVRGTRFTRRSMRLNLRVLSVGRLIFDWVSVSLCTFERVPVRQYFVLFPGTVCVYSVSLRDEPRGLGWQV